MLFVLNEAKDLRSIPSWSIAQRKIGRDPSHSLRMTESFNLTRNKHMRKTLTFVIAALIAAPALVYSETMKAIVVHEFGGPEVLKLEDVPRPEPKENEILIKVVAAGVNPVDAMIRSGKFGAKAPVIPGYDIAGIVERGFRTRKSDSRIEEQKAVTPGSCSS